MGLELSPGLGGKRECLGAGGPSVTSLPLLGFPGLVRGDSLAAGGYGKVTENLSSGLDWGLWIPRG